MGRKLSVLGIALSALAFAAADGSAQVRVGGQVSFADDADFGIGPRIALEIPRVLPGLWIVGSFDYFFPDEGLFGSEGDVDYWELNGNLLYEFEIPDTPGIIPYAGGGINIAHASFTTVEPIETDESNTEGGLNILGGAAFPLTGVTPFVEVRVEIEGGEQFVVTGGIMFP
ncbi:MAG: outer membrane protein [Gemmatimonadota bacterium]